jgi:hypothetical protein
MSHVLKNIKYVLKIGDNAIYGYLKYVILIKFV